MVNVDIAYELNTWPRNLANRCKFKNCLFGATNIVKDSDKKYLYKGYGITFDSGGLWSLIMTLLEMLQFLVLIIVHHLILTIARITF